MLPQSTIYPSQYLYPSSGAVIATILTQPRNGSCAYGQVYPISIEAVVGAGTLSYLWEVSSNGVTWTTAGTGATINVDTSNRALLRYRCKVTSHYGSDTYTITSDIALVTVRGPVFVTQPQSQNIYIGQTPTNITALVETDGEGFYYWMKKEGSGDWEYLYNEWVDDNGNKIVDSQNRGFASKSFPLSLGGITPQTETLGVTYYKCEAFDSLNGEVTSAISNIATITILDVPEPVVTVQPSSARYLQGSTPTPLSVTVSTLSGYTLTYQWQIKVDDTWTNITGATSQTYSPDTTQYEDHEYRCIITAHYGTHSNYVVSEGATITVYIDVPIIVSQPVGGSYIVPEMPSALAVAVTSSAGVLSYQWQTSDDTVVWTNISGATSASYYPPEPLRTVEVQYHYRCVITSTWNVSYTNSVISDAVVVTIIPPFPVITLQPVSARYELNVDATPLSVMASIPIGILMYQWQELDDNLNWVNINGAIQSSYTPSTARYSTRYYRCVVSNVYSTITVSTNSNVATITVKGVKSNYAIDDIRLEDGDLFVTDYDIMTTSSIRQQILIRLRWFAGEWIFQPDYGVKYYENMFVKNPSENKIISMLTNVIRSVEGVLEVDDMEIEIDNKTRKAVITFDVRTEEGRITEEVEIWTTV